MQQDLKSSFVRLIHQYQDIITSLCRVYYRQAADFEDARQDAILQLWKAYPAFRGEAAVSTWLYKVVLNTLLAKRRREQRRLTSEPLDRIAGLAASGGMDDDLELLRQMIDHLGDSDKAIVILHLEGYKNKEIAEMLDWSATKVSTKLHRIKTQLKTIFKRMNYEAG